MPTEIDRRTDRAFALVCAIIVPPLGIPILIDQKDPQAFPRPVKGLVTLFRWYLRVVLFPVWYPISMVLRRRHAAEVARRQRERDAVVRAEQEAAREARERAKREERSRLDRIRLAEEERLRLEAEAKLREQERLDREAKERADEEARALAAREAAREEQLERERHAAREQAKRELPALRESLLLLYAQHAPLISPRLPAEEFQDLVATELGDGRDLAEAREAGSAMEGRIRRLVAHEEIRGLYEENAEFVGENFSPRMFDLYLRDAMGDHRPVEDVEGAGERLREMLERLSIESPARLRRQREEADHLRRHGERDLVERLRAEGIPDDIIEIELAERRAAATSSSR